ncbi:hypothetical protein LCGC14_2274200 [marine sediment metagenome]|uniref:Uncharacterized protein n=1 Tax=marine sediment metagenome TaxID=412755 RepID=A0A0F9F8J4_9ZZZZ
MVNITEIRTIFRNELAHYLSNKKGARIVTIVTETDPGKSKKYKGIVKKQSYVNGIINFNYENSVNRQREREGNIPDFQVKPRKWGERVKNTPLITHKGNIYLEMKVQKVLRTEYFIQNKYGILVLTTHEKIKQYLRKKNNQSQQELTKQVILRDYKLGSIIGLVMDSITYKIGE